MRTDDLTHSLWALIKAADANGLACPDGFIWHLERGSKTYGRSYGLYWKRKETGGLYSAGNLPEYLGMTKADAIHTLRTIGATLWVTALLKGRTA